MSDYFGGAIAASQAATAAMRAKRGVKSRTGSGRKVSSSVSRRGSASPDWSKIGASKAARASAGAIPF